MSQTPVAAFLDVHRSLSGRRWASRLPENAAEALVPDIRRRLSVNDRIGEGFADTLSRFIAGRGIGPEQLDDFLTPTLKALFPEPESFLDLDKAAAAIIDALQARSRIVIFADYDVDGATSAAQLVRWLRAMGHDAQVYVPDRLSEGYGPSPLAFDRIKTAGADLVITVDCGAMAHTALEYAADIGLDVVVIDHHLMREDPPRALAVVNPNRPGCNSGQGNLAAAGVVFVVLAQLNREAEKRGLFNDRPKPDLRQWLDLAALGAICDVTALTGFNRALVAQGLRVMSGRHNPGIKALLEVAGSAQAASDLMSTFHSGFIIGPRINAGGRVGRSDLGVRLLSTDDSEEAADLARQLDELNVTRREVEAEVLEEAMRLAEQQGLILSEEPVLLVAAENWHPGVIGIVAGRLRERWRKPVIVVAIDPVTGLGKGSGRSQSGINLGAAVGAAYEAGLLLSGGGHAMAAGLSLSRDKLPEVRAFLNAHAHEQLGGEPVVEALEVDAVLRLKAVTRTLYERMSLLAPFGPGNPEPLMVLSPVRVGYASVMKGGHVRCELTDEEGGKLRCILWRAEGTPLGDAVLNPSGRLHVAGRLKADDYMGRNGVQFEIEDIAIV